MAEAPEVDVTLTGEFAVAKADDEAQVVFGWASVSQKADGTEVWDSDNENVPPEDLEHAAYEFVLESRDAGTDHDGGPAVGRLVESLVTTVEKQQALGLTGDELPVGWWVGFYVEDADAWASVKSGGRVMFSIDAVAEMEPAGKVAKAISGTVEERTEHLRQALQDAHGARWVYVRGTFDDRVVYEVSDEDGAEATYERTYSMDGEAPMLGAATEVRLVETVEAA